MWRRHPTHDRPRARCRRTRDTRVAQDIAISHVLSYSSVPRHIRITATAAHVLRLHHPPAHPSPGRKVSFSTLPDTRINIFPRANDRAALPFHLVFQAPQTAHVEEEKGDQGDDADGCDDDACDGAGGEAGCGGVGDGGCGLGGKRGGTAFGGEGVAGLELVGGIYGEGALG